MPPVTPKISDKAHTRGAATAENTNTPNTPGVTKDDKKKPPKCKTDDTTQNKPTTATSGMCVLFVPTPNLFVVLVSNWKLICSVH